ncbi:SatD family protein [Ferrimonas balearica]|uniref:SatD family protein n=1 Tax=Ferrimonas balearica TaxID=44012 RepID=UPI001C9964A0|nr:SatD family protein [Ferrimonas balearica]MBY5920234.1 SatD family protein [Ferrimonas balearica]MBY5997081.1 SatD family protein [Ferrimonas balearica]
MGKVAVLTGDIVDSQQLTNPEQEAYLHALEQTISLCAERFGARGEIFRGDAFQLLVEHPGHGLLVALLFRLTLRTLPHQKQPIDARIALGIGECETLPDRVSTGRGEAFVLSGRQLDEMNDARLAIRSTSPTLELFLPVLFRYLDTAVSGLNANAAHALLLKLTHPTLTHEALAKKMGVGRTSYTRFLNRAAYATLDETLSMFENAMGCDRFWKTEG